MSSPGPDVDGLHQHDDTDLADARRRWTDPRRPTTERVDALLAVMTTTEKVAQLGSTWRRAVEASPGRVTHPPGPDRTGAGRGSPDQGEQPGAVAPLATAFGPVQDWAELRVRGIGHLTRTFGTAPTWPRDGAVELARRQGELVANGRLGLPAIAHEECLTGVTTLGATVYPTPLALAATFDPELVRDLAAAIGADLAGLGVHQALAPVLDVVVDPRWGRTEETFGEDPHLVGTMAAAYVRGLESTGIVATLKHFAGHGASRAGRNHAPVSMGPREFADVHLVPFEHGLRHGGARSVMNSYADVDGVPPASDERLLTGLLRHEWGFTGTVVADYGAIGFLVSVHRVAHDLSDAAAQALVAGIDVELPESHAYLAPLVAAIHRGDVDAGVLDRAVRRVVTQKVELGLLDTDWDPTPTDPVDLDSPRNRDLARAAARASLVLLANDGVLPLGTSDADTPSHLALLGPGADDPAVLLGCYSFPNHVLPAHPEFGLGIPVSTIRTALAAALPGTEVRHARGCAVTTELDDAEGEGEDTPTDPVAEAVDVAAAADVAIVVLADLPGMFGRGTSGEGNDAADLHLPGRQRELARRVLDTGTPTILVVVSGRPYALGGLADRAGATIQAFLPGAEGATALAEVVTGQVEPRGRLPIQVPIDGGSQPAGYRHPMLGEPGLGISSADVVAMFPFGHGLSWTRWSFTETTTSTDVVSTAGTVTISCIVTNVGDRRGSQVVQLYLDRRVSRVVAPVRELVGVCRVEAPAGGRVRVSFDLHADRLAATGRDLRRAVEPGTIRLAVGSSAGDLAQAVALTLHGPRRRVGHDRVLATPTRVEPLP